MGKKAYMVNPKSERDYSVKSSRSQKVSEEKGTEMASSSLNNGKDGASKR